MIKKITPIAFLISIISSNLFSQIDSIDYLGQTPPGNIQTLFNLEVTEGYSPVERVAISSDGKDFYYSELDLNYSYQYTHARIKHYSYQDNAWSEPEVLFEGYYTPSLSADDSTMFLQKANSAEVWCSQKTDTGWSIPFQCMINNNIVGSFQQTNNGTYYCSANNAIGGIGGEDVSKMIISDTDTTFKSLGFPINKEGVDYYLYMAKDESYAITYTFNGGGADLEGRALISYPKEDGSWTNPKQMGFGGWATCVSPDNKYLFYTSIIGRDYNTYWIRIDNIIDSLRHTNFKPYIKNRAENQTTSVGQPFNYTLPDSVFIDDDGNNTLTYEAKLTSGNPIPEWLDFDSTTLSFSGIPTEAQSLYIRVKATDTEDISVITMFNLNIEDSTTNIHQNLNHSFQIYPNPTKGLINIFFGNNSYNNVEVEITDIDGRTCIKKDFQNTLLETIDLTSYPKGVYIVNIIADNDKISKKIYLE